MRKLGLLLLCLCLASKAHAQIGALTGFCVQGGVSSTTSGLPSTNKLQGVIPSCTLTVYLSGTQTLATLYADGLSTPLSNPFTAAALGSVAPGQWIFYTAANQAYDVVLSGGIAPNVYARPVTLKGLSIGGGSGGGSSPPIYSVQYASGTSGGFGSSPGITINPATVTLQIAGSGTGNVAVCGITSGNCVNNTVSPTTNGMYAQAPSAAPAVSAACLTGTVTGTQGGLPYITESWSAVCGTPTNPGFTDQLSAPITSSSTSFNLLGSGYNLGPGYFYIDSEWIYYSSIQGSTVTVAAGGRGYFGTTAASHTASGGSPTVGCIVCLSNPSSPPFNPTVGNQIAGSAVMGIGNAFPTSDNGQVTLDINSGSNLTAFDHQGAIHQVSPTSALTLVRTTPFLYGQGNEFGAPLYVGVNAVNPITDTSYVVIANQQNQVTQPQGLSGGIAGPVTTVQAATVGAPQVFPIFNGGSSTWSYICEGVDSDGNTFPGTTGSTTTAAASLSFPQSISGKCPYAAGAVNYKVYRTAGGPNAGLLATLTQQGGLFTDLGATLDGTSPSGSNGDIPRVCNNNGQWCALSGTSGTPPLTCTSAQAGWEYHITSATSTPFVLHCVSGSWVTAY